MTTIGILGGGQLGRMLALAGYPLGLRFRFFDPASDAPVDPLADRIARPYDDWEALQQFAAQVDSISYEFENVPVTTARFLERTVPVYPPPAALEVAQDRLDEKTFLASLGIPTPAFAAVNSSTELRAAVDQIGLPAILKTRRLGYDGKGQFLLREPEDSERAWAALGGVPLILEGFVPFAHEASILAVRNVTGATTCYPLMQNTHRDGILRLSLAPAPDLPASLQALAQEYAERVLSALEYVGVLAIEFFQVGDSLIANEMAPRVHNSGHWTIEGAATSQFENHLRAILGLPLGATTVRGAVAMVNLIGALPETAAVLAIPNAHLHLYDKEPRPGRKIGHITLCAEDHAALAAVLPTLQALVPAG